MSFPALDLRFGCSCEIPPGNPVGVEAHANQAIECERCNSQREIASEIACQTETYAVFQPIPKLGINTSGINT
jgi:hypothetical protein